MARSHQLLKLVLTLLLVGTATVLIVHSGALSLGYAQEESPVTLPNDCVGVTAPGEDPPVCCAAGYVYFDGVPVPDAAVSIQDATGVITTTSTTRGPVSDHPYYQVDLSRYGVAPGDTITVTAMYSDSVGISTHEVITGGQQVDVVISTDLIGSNFPSFNGQTSRPFPR